MDVIYRGPGRRFVIDGKVLERDGEVVKVSAAQWKRMEGEGQFDATEPAPTQTDKD